MNHRVSYKTIFKHYYEHENELLTSAEVMETFGIKTLLTLYKKRRDIRQDETIKDRANLLTFNYLELVPGKGCFWRGGTMYVNPKTASDKTQELIQDAADMLMRKYSNIIQVIEQIQKPAVKAMLLKNQSKELKRISHYNK